MVKDFTTLRKNLKKDFSGFRKLKVALLGDHSTQFFNQAIRATGFDYQLDLEILEADYNQIDQVVFNQSSFLYAEEPDIVIITQSSKRLLSNYNKSKNKHSFFEEQRDKIEDRISLITNSLPNTKVLFCNFPEINDAVFGNYANQINHSFLYQIRKLNVELMEMAIQNKALHIVDVLSLQTLVGTHTLEQSSLYYLSDIWLSIDVLPSVSKLIVDIISAIYGKIKKCLILDLDNTLWGGIIGDDGIEQIQVGDLGLGKAFTDFQYWIKKLKDRGIILAVCSKNTESIAKEPFEKHPEMVLRLDDFVMFVANWQNKADNIRTIQSVLNIGFDSMVFIDDNPFERNLVRENLPEVTVPEMPEDPTEYLSFLYEQNLFETVSYSASDKDRSSQYQIEAKRVQSRKSYTNENEFLASLGMESGVEMFDKFNIPRVAQLTQRSNQFNLRTIRYSESDALLISNSQDSFGFAFRLADKFGDHGLISVVVLKRKNDDVLFIENWLMSCRVLGRSMEKFTLNVLADFAKNKGFRFLEGEYLPTKKNVIVEKHYENLGFTQSETIWRLNLDNFSAFDTNITRVEGKE